jgi:4-hydroxyphenylpyruvate dioxygenase
MGPFPHDAAPATISAQNPGGTDGFEFVEFAHPDPSALSDLFERMGYAEVARHRSKDISLYRQGEINYVINRESDSHAAGFVAAHGPCASAMAWRVVDAGHALKRAVELGATEYCGPGKTLDVPAVIGIGGSLLYFVDTYRNKDSSYSAEFRWIGEADPKPIGAGFYYLDHLTHNVARGNMDTWYKFYARTFNFREIRYFNISGKLTGLTSRALTSPCGKIRIPINESSDDKSQIEEYLHHYKGEGIQHIALSSTNLQRSVDKLRANGMQLLATPDTYYELIDKRIAGHGEDVAELRRRQILVDGTPGELLLQIFSENQLGPIFFEFIQRKGNEGFGEGNFKALFESIELDQIRRGVLKADIA